MQGAARIDKKDANMHQRRTRKSLGENGKESLKMEFYNARGNSNFVSSPQNAGERLTYDRTEEEVVLFAGLVHCNWLQ